MELVRKAVITAAGRGTRQFPATRSIQKELLPLVDCDGITKPTIQVIATDRGPGIPDVERVLSPTYRSTSGMGRGLRGTRTLMDYFDIYSRPGEGTIVTVRKAVS